MHVTCHDASVYARLGFKLQSHSFHASAAVSTRREARPMLVDMVEFQIERSCMSTDVGDSGSKPMVECRVISVTCGPQISRRLAPFGQRSRRCKSGCKIHMCLTTHFAARSGSAAPALLRLAAARQLMAEGTFATDVPFTFPSTSHVVHVHKCNSRSCRLSRAANSS